MDKDLNDFPAAVDSARELARWPKRIVAGAGEAPKAEALWQKIAKGWNA